MIPALPAGSNALVRHLSVNKIAFISSTATGRPIAEAAAAKLKHVSLELGGKAAALVLEVVSRVQWARQADAGHR